MKFAKVRDVKSPSRGTDKSAGIDFYVPKATEEFIEEVETKNFLSILIPCQKYNFYIKPFSNVLFPLGVKVNVPEGYSLVFFNKSGIASEKGLIVGACVIDEDYQGELSLNLINTTNELVSIDFDKKIVQGVLIKMNYFDIIQTDESELFSYNSKRGTGGFGSTGL